MHTIYSRPYVCVAMIRFNMSWYIGRVKQQIFVQRNSIRYREEPGSSSPAVRAQLAQDHPRSREAHPSRATVRRRSPHAQRGLILGYILVVLAFKLSLSLCSIRHKCISPVLCLLQIQAHWHLPGAHGNH